MIGPGIIALIVFIGVVVVVNVVMKKNIAFAMFIAWLATLLVAGAKAPEYFVASLKEGITGDVIFPSMYFCFMADMMNRTGIIRRLVNIMNSAFGRIPGGAGYVSTMTSALMGSVSGSGPGNAAVAGSITIPWMKGSGFSNKIATTIVAGNATLGMSIPPSTSMFMLLAMPAIVGKTTSGDLYMACMAGGMYILAFRLITVFYYTKKYGIKAVDRANIMPLKETMQKGWKSLFIFLGVIIPLLITTGPISTALSNTSFGAAGVKAIDMMVWIPVLLTVIVLIEGRKYLPKFTNLKEWHKMLSGDIMTYPTVGGTIVFSIAGSGIMTRLGLSKEMEAIFSSIGYSTPIITVILVGIAIMIVAGPLNSTGTLVTLGSVSFIALTSAGVAPAVALTAMLLFAATEGCVPPASAPLYVASGISGLQDPSVCFKDLMFIYALGSFVVATLVGAGLLPLF
jgi:TRAP-type C4-dicarboxylate transport system permease large subunit